MTEEEKKTTQEGNENLDPDEFDDDEDTNKGTDNPDGDGSDESNGSKTTKSEEELEKEKRAEFARKRREREAAEKEERERKEREERIKREAATQAELGMIKENPWTKKPIKDEKDLEIYKIMKELDDQGKDPLEDLPEALAERARKREEESKKAVDDEKKVADELKKEIDDLRKKYPKVNTRELADDPLYNEIAEEKGGRWTVTEIYEEYLKRKGTKKPDADEDEQHRIEEIAKGNKQTSSNGGSAGKGGQKPVSEMTPEEFRAYYKQKYHR